MITANFAEVAASLRKAKEEIDRKLENMVRQFAYHVTLTAIENTPLGDSITYYKYYQRRQKATGLQPVEGFAQGSWQVNTDGSFSIQETYSGAEAGVLAKSNLSSYKLGQSVYIGNMGYYIQVLENGYSDQAPMGIMQPTSNQIVGVLQADLVRFYQEG